MKVISDDYPDGIEITLEETLEEIDGLISQGWPAKTEAALAVVREAMVNAIAATRLKELGVEVTIK